MSLCKSLLVLYESINFACKMNHFAKMQQWLKLLTLGFPDLHVVYISDILGILMCKSVLFMQLWREQYQGCRRSKDVQQRSSVPGFIHQQNLSSKSLEMNAYCSDLLEWFIFLLISNMLSIFSSTRLKETWDWISRHSTRNTSLFTKFNNF